jgi:hypothetical protein
MLYFNYQINIPARIYNPKNWYLIFEGDLLKVINQLCSVMQLSRGIEQHLAELKNHLAASTSHLAQLRSRLADSSSQLSESSSHLTESFSINLAQSRIHLAEFLFFRGE